MLNYIFPAKILFPHIFYPIIHFYKYKSESEIEIEHAKFFMFRILQISWLTKRWEFSLQFWKSETGKWKENYDKVIREIITTSSHKISFKLLSKFLAFYMLKSWLFIKTGQHYVRTIFGPLVWLLQIAAMLNSSEANFL